MAEVVLLGVLSAHFSAIVCYAFTTNALDVFGNFNGCTEYFVNGFWITLAEVSAGIVVRGPAL